jgi:putative transcriptional regulator
MWDWLAVLSVLAVIFPFPRLPTCEQSFRNAQYGFNQPPSVGKILVANEKLEDPNFAHSVVLILQSDPDVGRVGLIINRRTAIPISKIFSKMEHASADPVYMGGPVDTTAVEALLRLSEKAAQTIHIMSDVYATGAKELIDKSIASRVSPSKFHLYLGYAAWAPGQLEAEIQLGAWTVLSHDLKIVFDADPDSLWSRLSDESQMQIASARTSRSKILDPLTEPGVPPSGSAPLSPW